MKITCCYGCKDRVVGCHGTCEKYINEKETNEKFKKLEIDERRIQQSLQHMSINKFAAISKSRKEM